MDRLIHRCLCEVTEDALGPESSTNTLILSVHLIPFMHLLYIVWVRTKLSEWYCIANGTHFGEDGKNRIWDLETICQPIILALLLRPTATHHLFLFDREQHPVQQLICLS